MTKALREPTTQLVASPVNTEHVCVTPQKELELLSGVQLEPVEIFRRSQSALTVDAERVSHLRRCIEKHLVIIRAFSLAPHHPGAQVVAGAFFFPSWNAKKKHTYEWKRFVVHVYRLGIQLVHLNICRCIIDWRICFCLLGCLLLGVYQLMLDPHVHQTEVNVK